MAGGWVVMKSRSHKRPAILSEVGVARLAA